MSQNLYLPGPTWLSTITDIDQRLHSQPPARIANIGCADGWFSIGLAHAYPKVRVDGFDLDEEVVERAWRNAHNSGLTDRITFHVRDVGDPTLNGRYDLCIAYQCILTFSNPVGVLATMRRLAGRKGLVILVDEYHNKPKWAEMLRGYARGAGYHTIETLEFKGYHLVVYRLYSHL